MDVSTRFGARAAAIAALVTVMLAACGAVAWGQVSLTTLGSAYTQDFSGLASSGTSSTVPSGWAFLETGANANTTYTAGTGSNNTGDTYSLGAASSSERAFGGLRSSNLVPYLGASFTNNTGSTIDALAIAYTGEQWRLGYSGHTDKIMFAYSTDATSLNTGTWTTVTALDFSSPITSGTVGLLDGNAAANRTAIASTISGLAIANGATFWIRWTDYDPTGADDVLAVDDFSLTATGTPTYTLTYTAGPGGTISGTSPQTVAQGGSGTEVTAVPNPGYHFTSWSDGVLTAARTETNVTADVDVTASFGALPVHNVEAGTYFATINAAIGDAGTLNGHTLQVAAGTYEEQVLVTKALTITGAGCGSTVIRSPVTLTQSYAAPQGTTKPIVFVDGVDATIQNLTIDGAGRGNDNLRFVALGFWNGGGKAANLCILHMADTPASTANHGAGIHAYNDTGGPYGLEVDHVTATEYQKTGIVLEGAGLTVNVHDCVTTGRGYTAEGPGQNGIQVSRGAVGAVTRCKVTDVGYINATYASSGVLLYDTPGPVTVSDCRGDNRFSNVQVSVYVYNASGVVDGIEVAGGADSIGICAANANASALLGSAEESLAGPHIALQPLPFGGDVQAGVEPARSASPAAAPATSYTLSVTNSCLYGSDVAGSVGIMADSYGGGMDVTATRNVLRDWDRALLVYAAPATLTAHENSISSNVTAGFDAVANPGQDAARNWWGDAGGPAGGDAAPGADYEPWIHSGTNQATGCGFLPPTYTLTASAGEHGSISPAGTLTAYEGDDVTYTITPDSSYGIVDVLVDGTSVGAVPGHTFTNVTADHTIEASFAYQPAGVGPAPAVTTLQPAMPNPSHGGVTLAFGLAERGPVELRIYSVDGRLVRTLVSGTQEPGYYRPVWDGRDEHGSAMPAGVFYARLAAGRVHVTRTVSYLK